MSEACRYLCAILGVEKDRALLVLASAARDGTVRARCSDVATWARNDVHMAWQGRAPISWRPISPEEWDVAYWLHYSGNALPGIGGLIEFNTADLIAHFRLDRAAGTAQKPKQLRTSEGRPRGTGYQDADAAIHKKMHELLSKKQAGSPRNAARHFLRRRLGVARMPPSPAAWWTATEQPYGE